MPPTIRSRQEELAILEVNDLVLFAYNSIYGQAFEVLTKNGKHRVCHGNNREQVVKEAVAWLEARAVLTGKPMATGRMLTAAANQLRDAADTHRAMYEKLVAARDHELQKLMMEKFLKEAQIHVPDLDRLSPVGDVSGKGPGGVG